MTEGSCAAESKDAEESGARDDIEIERHKIGGANRVIRISNRKSQRNGALSKRNPAWSARVALDAKRAFEATRERLGRLVKGYPTPLKLKLSVVFIPNTVKNLNMMKNFFQGTDNF